MTEDRDITTQSELDEPVSGLPMANSQASKVLPAGELEPLIEGAGTSSQAARADGLFERLEGKAAVSGV